MSDPLKPDRALLCKLGSIAIHVEEHLSANGQPVDLDSAISIINDEQVQVWLYDMNALALLPIKR